MLMKWIYILLLAFVFSGCDLLESVLESEKEKAEKIANEKIAFEKKVEDSKEIQLQKLSAETKKELAILESKKELAKIEKERELEKIRMQSELEKQRMFKRVLKGEEPKKYRNLLYELLGVIECKRRFELNVEIA